MIVALASNFVGGAPGFLFLFLSFFSCRTSSGSFLLSIHREYFVLLGCFFYRSPWLDRALLDGSLDGSTGLLG